MKNKKMIKKMLNFMYRQNMYMYAAVCLLHFRTLRNQLSKWSLEIDYQEITMLKGNSR